MIKNFEWMIAWRYLKPQRQEGVVSIMAAFSFFGIMLGVATLIIVMAVMNGFREELMNKIVGFNGHISLYANKENPLPDTLLDYIKSLPHVKNARFFIDQQALVLKGGNIAGVQVRAIDFQDLENSSHFQGKIHYRAIESMHPVVVLGRRLADKLHLDVGQTINILIPQRQNTAFGRLPKSQKCMVTGIFTMGMSIYDESFIFMPLKDAQNLFNTFCKNIEIFLNNADDLMVTMPALNQALINLPGVQVIDWQHSNSHFFNAIKVERNVMFIILTLIILVAAFNIISSMIMVVKDKTTSIAILRTMGASKGSILTIFFLTGSFIGITGTAAGVALGLGFSYHIENIRQWLERLSNNNLFSAEIYFLSKLPAIVKVEDVVLVTVMALLLSLMATFYPSWRATMVDPAETLRYG